ncbi:MAG: DUF6114 domain-containing protein [Candidatus Hadarchaeales archaeon]
MVGSRMGNIGLGFFNLWDKRRLVLPLFLLLSIFSWVLYILVYNLATFTLAVVSTVFLFTVLLLGTVVVDGIEAGLIPLERVPNVVLGSLLGIGIVFGLLLYLFLLVLKLVPFPPPSFLFALVSTIEIVPFVSLAIVLPPTAGYFLFRERWRRLRANKPFWGVYLGILAAFCCVYPLLPYPDLWFHEMKTLATAGSLILLSLFLLAYPREGATKAVGLIFPFVGFLSWFTCFGGMALGSVLAVLAGACSYSWSPSEKLESRVFEPTLEVVPEETSQPLEVKGEVGTGGSGLEKAVENLLRSLAPSSDTREETPNRGVELAGWRGREKEGGKA